MVVLSVLVRLCAVSLRMFIIIIDYAGILDIVEDSVNGIVINKVENTKALYCGLLPIDKKYMLM